MSPAKAAGSFFEAMKSQPIALALVLVNLALLYLFYDIRRHEITLQAEHQKQVNELVARFCSTSGNPP